MGLIRWAGLAVLILLLGWSQHNRGLWKGRADERGERADSALAALHDYESAYQSVSAQAETAIRVAEEGRDSANARADRADRRRPAIIERVVHDAGPDSAVVRVAVEEVADSIEANEVLPLRAAVTFANSIIAARSAELDAAIRVNGALRLALATSQSEAKAWQRAAKPRLFGLFHVEPGPALLIGGVLGAVGAVAVLR